MKENYQVTISYTSVITVDIRAIDEEEAKYLAEKQWKQPKFQRGTEIQIDQMEVAGVLNMSKSWDKID